MKTGKHTGDKNVLKKRRERICIFAYLLVFDSWLKLRMSQKAGSRNWMLYSSSKQTKKKKIVLLRLHSAGEMNITHLGQSGGASEIVSA